MFPLASASSRATKPHRGRQGDAGAFDAAPLLKDGAERLLAALTKNLGAMAGPAVGVEGALVGFRLVALRDHLAAQRPGAVAVSLECAEPGCTLLATLDAALVHGIVELLCGGNGSECRADDMRPATAIDAQYAQIVATLVAAAVAGDWKDRGFSTAKPGRIEGTPSADVCGAAVTSVGVVTMALAVFGLRGLLTLALPPVALQAFSGDVEARGEPVSADPGWAAMLRGEVSRAPVTVGVLLDAQPLSLRLLSELRPGQVLALAPDARTRAALVCDGRTLYRGEIGQEESRFSFRIDEFAPPGAGRPAAATAAVARPSLPDVMRA